MGHPYRSLLKSSPSWWQRLKCWRGWCFKELVRIEEHHLYDLWVQECPYCGERSDAVDDPLL